MKEKAWFKMEEPSTIRQIRFLDFARNDKEERKSFTSQNLLNPSGTQHTINLVAFLATFASSAELI
ncbi:hypothetical protein H8S95_04080 [Pontibacter sp. KCTC 32443]|uniref:hypothetical protein n=1 Tax=Pontibacter TaxID=323449 RepID=UPI00164D002E|nr:MULTISPECIES: hypothetical protein [Pontibacter]MBC5773232.1 hypothetical protein [Pontibacter sp. KCTC 32443]